MNNTRKRNNKAQFFIASAVIIIIILYFIYFNVLNVNESDHSELEFADFSFVMNNIENEYGSIVEQTLVNASNTPAVTPNNALNTNLSYFTAFVENLTAQRHIVADITATNSGANASYMNASVSIVLRGLKSEVSHSFSAVREIILTKIQTVVCTTQPGAGPPPVNKLDFRLKVTKEYGEPITGLVQTDFNVELAGTSVVLTAFTDQGAGIYLFESSQACVLGNNLKVNATDHRKIFGTKTQTT